MGQTWRTCSASIAVISLPVFGRCGRSAEVRPWRPDEVEDVVQECLLAMHNVRHTYQPDQPLTAWAHAIARHKLIDVLRAKSARESLHDPLDDETALFAASETEASDARRDLDGLLDTLPEKQRAPIRCVKLQGLSVAETARITGLSESAVKVGIHRGLKALAKLVGAAA
ncbi:sigma-70 family RNA polymerase sigma factor [Ramlibacter sp. RBP-2]|uniref:Sigma-70 family RNA polymerase sigma factor n=1 Tax=Ramlibacter lithotrophicus TaxID=2606681 RepID=A0A7X6I4V5_9BURK|nr:sigma-70 family RNA polymerase sigma factor [Ramlibacter lithotrophicus]